MTPFSLSFGPTLSIPIQPAMLFVLSTVPKPVLHHGECPSVNEETDTGISCTLPVSLSDAPRVPKLSSCLSD